MKKIMSFLSSLALLVSSLPLTTAFAESSFELTIAQDELFENLENGKFTADVNMDGVFDYFDVFEFLLYYDKGYVDDYDAEIEAYGITGIGDEKVKSVNALAALSLNVYGVEENFAWYYIYKGNEFPEKAEMEKEFETYEFLNINGAEYVETFFETVDKINQKLNGTKNEEEFSEYELELFQKIDSGELNPDVNLDGKIDSFDAFEILTYYGYVSVGKTAEDFGNEEIWNTIKENGDIDGNGVGASDSAMLLSYVFRYKGFKFESVESIEKDLSNYREDFPEKESLADSIYFYYYEDTAEGDVDMDGKVDATDASAVLAYYAEVSTGKDVDITTEKNMKYLGDLNSDKKADATDASNILKMYSENSTK